MDPKEQPEQSDLATKVFSVEIGMTSDGRRQFNVVGGTLNPPVILVKELMEWALTVVMTSYINSLVDKKLSAPQKLIKPEVVMPRTMA